VYYNKNDVVTYNIQQSAPDNLRGLSLIIAASLPELCGFFSLSSYVSDDISGKNSVSWVIYFCYEPLYNEGFSFTLGQQASPLRKRSLPHKGAADENIFSSRTV
jgi:hypothetical protein